MNITDFTVGLDLDASQYNKGLSTASNDLLGFKSSILQMGATLAGVFSAKALTIDFATQNDRLRQTADLLGVTTDQLFGLNKAGEVFGAQSNEITATFERIIAQRARLKQFGDLGFFGDLAKLGVNIEPITNARNEYEAYLETIRQISQLDTKKQLTASQILGVSPQQLDMMRKGSDYVDRLSKSLAQARPHTEEMSNASRKLYGEWEILSNQLGGFSDRIATPLVKGLGTIVEDTNLWFDANQNIIDQGLDKTVKYLGDNLATIGTIGATIAGSGLLSTFASLTKHVPILGAGLSTVVGAMTRLVPLIGAGALAYQAWDWKADDVEKLIGIKPPDWLFTPVEDLLPNVKGMSMLNTVAQNVGDSTVNFGDRAKEVQSAPKTYNINVNMDGQVISRAVVKEMNGNIEQIIQDSVGTEQ